MKDKAHMSILCKYKLLRIILYPFFYFVGLFFLAFIKLLETNRKINSEN
jgi:hypothetical protein